MGVSGQKFDLSQMKEYFDSQIPNIRLISDLTLSKNDFQCLGEKLKSAFSLRNSRDGMEELIICYLVYWVYALIYWEENQGIHDELTDYCAKLPQYQIRYHFQLLLETFADYDIADYGYTAESVEERCSMLIARHAGIPNDEKYQVFELIDDYRKQTDSVEIMVADIYAHLPYKSRYIFSLLDERSRIDMIWEIRTIMAEVSLHQYSRDELLEKYPHTSVSLIDYCFYWKEGRELLNQGQ